MIKKELEKLNLGQVLNKYPHLFEFKYDTNGECVTVRALRPDTFSTTEVSVLPSPNRNISVSPKASFENDMNLLHSALKELERYLGLNEVFDFFQVRLEILNLL